MIVFSEKPENLQFILDQQLSDHKPVLGQGFLSWNMLCLCRTVNNGFRMDETLEEAAAYKVRLKRAALCINEWVKQAAAQKQSIEVICLQEAPFFPEHLNLFLESLQLESFDLDSVIMTQTGPHKFQNLTLFSKHYSGKLITDLLPVHQSCQKSRYHVLELTNKETNAQRRVGNVHLEWFPRQKMHFREATRAFIKELLFQNCSLMGDFNQSLGWILEDPELQKQIQYFYYPEQNNISFTKNSSQAIHYGQIDALILL